MRPSFLTTSRDEVLYQAKLHPEQYSNTFSDAQIKQLHDSLIQVCTIAVETLADSSKFPEDCKYPFDYDQIALTPKKG